MPWTVFLLLLNLEDTPSKLLPSGETEVEQGPLGQ